MARGWAGITIQAIWSENNHLFNHHGKTLLSVAATDAVTVLVTATVIFITDTFIQLAGLFQQLLARGDSMNPIPNLLNVRVFRSRRGCDHDSKGSY